MFRATIPARQQGFTLLETAVITLMLTLVMGSMITAVFHSKVFSADYAQDLIIDQTGRRVLDRLAEELQAASPGTLAPLVLSDYVTFQKVTGFQSGAAVLGPVTTIDRQAVSEAEKSSKNKGVKKKLQPDGNVSTSYFSYDDGFLTLTEFGNPPVQIAGRVLALRFEPVLGGIKVSVDVGMVNREDLIVQKTFTQQVTFRN